MAYLGFAGVHYSMLALWSFVGFLVGRQVTRSFSYQSRCEAISCSTALGFGVQAYLVFGLGLCGWLYPSVVWAVLIAELIGCLLVWAVLPIRRPDAEDTGRAQTKTDVGRLSVLSLAVVVASAPWWLLPLYPPTQWDATSYHLAVAKIYTQSHAVIVTPFLRFAVFPQLNEMLFALALLISDDIAAQLTQWAMMVLVAIMLYVWGRRISSPRVGLWASALWLGSPLVVRLGTSAHIDVGLTLFITVGAYALFQWRSTRRGQWLVLAAVFIGLAASTKYSGALFLLTFGVMVALQGVGRQRWAFLAIFGCIAIGLAAPWYLRNAFHTGNPVFPFLPQAFGYSQWSPDDMQGQLHEMRSYGLDRTPISFLSLWWALAFRQSLFHADAAISPVIFLAFPFVMGSPVARQAVGWIWWLSLGYLCCWFAFAQVLRYLLPLVALLSLAAAVAIDDLIRRLPMAHRWMSARFMTAAGAVCLIAPGWLDAAQLVQRQGPVPIRHAQRQAYLAAHLMTYPAYALLNDLRGTGYRVYALFDESMAYFADGVFMGDYFGPARYRPILDAGHDGEALYRQLTALGADYFLVRDHRDGWRIDPPDDAAFHRHFTRIGSWGRVSLFQLVADASHES